MSITRRSFHRHLLAAAALALAGAAHAAPEEGGMRQGKVFTSTNNAAGNELLAFGSGPAGALTLLARYPTQGLGSGNGLGSQGAVTLSGDGRWLFVVNAGSNSISTFAVRPGGLQLASVHDAGGLRPISVSEREGLVYVVSADGAGNVAGFRNEQGTLVPIAGGVQPLSAAGGTAPAQVAIGTEGDVLVVTEKNTNRLTTYAIAADGSIGAPQWTASSGLTPFGFAFDRRNRIFVSEANGGAANASALSSYRFDPAAPTTPVLVSGSVSTGQTAACWAVVSPNGRYAYTANAGSGSVSAYAIDRNGAATLVNGIAAATGPNSGPTDLAVAAHGRTLAVLAARISTVFTYTIGGDGSLVPADTATGLPAGTVGIAAN